MNLPFKYFLPVFLALIGAGQLLHAQEVQINEPPQITAMMRNWANANRTNPKVEGWRIQIMASTDRQQIEEGKLHFKHMHPEIPADWIHEKPYYKLRVGAFRSEREAYNFIPKLSGFPGAYPARDAAIHPRDFLDF